MRPTMILYAHPDTFRLLSEDCKRFSGTRWTLRERLFAAWRVFTGQADALDWSEWEKWKLADHDLEYSDPRAYNQFI